MPNSGNQPQTLEVTASASDTPTLISIAIGQATLTEKVNQVIGDHERRITTLETQRAGAGGKSATIAASIAAVIAVVLSIADNIRWN